jgi:hypothetical protein
MSAYQTSYLPAGVKNKGGRFVPVGPDATAIAVLWGEIRRRRLPRSARK